MSDIRLSAGRLQLSLLPEVGGSIGRFDWIGDDGVVAILRSAEIPESPLQAGCFPLVPYCNRIRDGGFRFGDRDVRIAPNMAGDPSPLHGQGWLSAWQVEKHSRAGAELLFRHPAGEWPWAYEARQHFVLNSRGLTVGLTCRNLTGHPMPCGLGLHPYFPCGPDTQLATHVENVWTVDENILPVARIPAEGRYDLSGGVVCGRGLDNGYDGWCGQAAIETPGSRMPQIRMSSPGTRFFQLYSPVEGGLFVAEPVSHANAALNAPQDQWPQLGLKILGPGQHMTLWMRVELL